MLTQILEGVRRLQAQLVDAGVARSVLALPAPRMMALPAPTSEEISEDILFAKFVDEPEIVGVSRDLFVSGFFNQAVAEAFKAVDRFVQTKSGKADLSGTALMDVVFSPTKPLLVWTDRASTSEVDEQKGYHRLFSGSMLGLRNPCTHEHNWIDDAASALECIVFAQHLLRKAKSSHMR